MSHQRQIALGPVLAGVAALLLLASLFFDWFEPGLSAWTIFEVLDLLLAALALATMAIAAQALGMGLSGARVPAAALLPVAVVALVIVVSQLIHQPPGALGRGLEVGAWLALGAVVVLVAGATLGSSYVSVVRVNGSGESAAEPPRTGTPAPGPRPGAEPPRTGTPAPGPRPGAEPPRTGEEPPTRPLSRSEPERPA